MALPLLHDRLWTVAEVHALPDDPRHRYEVVDGELLVSPGPTWPHQNMIFYLQRILDDHLTEYGGGVVMDGPAEIQPDDRTMVQPDLFVVPLVDGRAALDWFQVNKLSLAVEVMSPGTQRYDRVVKRRLYHRLGAEYWIVDLDARVIERWGASDVTPEIIDDRISWTPPGSTTELVIELEPLFRKAWREG
jgi:Uma2 family endonuclease